MFVNFCICETLLLHAYFKYRRVIMFVSHSQNNYKFHDSDDFMAKFQIKVYDMASIPFWQTGIFFSFLLRFVTFHHGTGFSFRMCFACVSASRTTFFDKETNLLIKQTQFERLKSIPIVMSKNKRFTFSFVIELLSLGSEQQLSAKEMKNTAPKPHCSLK